MKNKMYIILLLFSLLLCSVVPTMGHGTELDSSSEKSKYQHDYDIVPYNDTSMLVQLNLKSMTFDRFTISHCTFSSAPECLKKIESIGWLTIEAHDIDSLPLLLESLSSMEITCLCLKDMALAEIPKEIKQLNFLRKISFQNIGKLRITHELPDSLTVLISEENDSVYFSDSVNYDRIIAFIVDVSKMKVFPKSIVNLKNLEGVNIRLKKIGCTDFDFSSILILNSIPSFNGLMIENIVFSDKGIPKPVFELSRLKELEIDNKDLHIIDTSILKLSNLEFVDLSGNGFIEFPKILFSLPKIKSIYMIDNKISTFEDPCINVPKSLKLISLDFNPIKTEELRRIKDCYPRVSIYP